MYEADLNQPFDSFTLTGTDPTDDAAVTFSCTVVDGEVSTSFRKSISKGPNGVVSPDGTTITIGEREEIYTGTIISGPGTSLQFPGNTVVIGSNHSVPNDVAIISTQNGQTVKDYNDVADLNAMEWILAQYPNGSIPALVVVGHGSGEGGISFGGPADPDFSGVQLQSGNYNDLKSLIRNKLADNANVYILGCDQFEAGSVAGLQAMANELGRPVVANEDPVAFDADWNPNFFVGQGNWVRVDPQVEVEDEEGPSDDSPPPDGP